MRTFIRTFILRIPFTTKLIEGILSHNEGVRRERTRPVIQETLQQTGEGIKEDLGATASSRPREMSLGREQECKSEPGYFLNVVIKSMKTKKPSKKIDKIQLLKPL